MHDLRRATRAQLHEAASWIDSQHAAASWAGRRISFPIDLTTLEQALEFHEATSWALVDSSFLCAFGQVVPKPAGRQHLARLIVNPSRREQGFGKALAQHLLNAAQETGQTRISLNVDPENEPALALYLGLGFARASRPPDEAESDSLYLEHAGTSS